MAMDKLYRRLEAKIDALLEKNGLKPADFNDAPAPARTRELTAAEQQAIDNAPKAEASVPPQEQGPRVTAQNAPDTSSSVPSAPRDAVGNGTVETKRASDSKRK